MDVVEQQSARETELAAEIATLTERAGVTEAELAAAEDVLAGERAALEARRAEALEQLGAAGAATYQRLRKSYGGVAISRLHAGRCGACHLDQSRAALDALKHLAQGTWTECEQCGRLLVP
jgi:predicted  nucleic acid-binding Zn-ribbon protein